MRLLLALFLALYNTAAYPAAAVFSGSDVKILKPNLDFNGQSKILSGTVDPTSVATSAPIGSLYLNSSTGIFYRKLDAGSTTNWAIVGSGAGGINYIANGDGESNTSGWATYSDGASATPVDGTGGSPNITFTRVTSSPLRGNGMFRITKDAANRQGEGASYAFTIANSDKATPLNISFEYASSANAVAGSDSVTGDINVYIYDVTNATVIQPAPYKLTGGTGNNWKYSGTFQTSYNSTSYRLIFHVAGTNASAATYDFDNIVLGPQIQLYGAPVTDPVAYTPTFTGFGTPTGISFVSWRDGAYLFVEGTFTAGTNTATEARITLGYQGANANVTTTASLPTLSAVGKMDGGTASATFFSTATVLAEASKTYLTLAPNTSSNGFVKANGSSFTNTVTYSLFARVPITGWSSSLLMSNDTDTRIVAFRGTNTAGTTLTRASFNTIPFATTDYDTHGAWSTNTYTVPVPGKYAVKCNLTLATGGTWASGDNFDIEVDKNGSLHTSTQTLFFGTYAGKPCVFLSATVDAKAGDTITIVANPNKVAAGSINMDTAVGNNTVSIERLSGPSAIAASETVAARYYGATATVTGTLSDVTWSTKDSDSHGGMSSATYTIPTPGKYDFVGALYLTAASVAAGNSVAVQFMQNGATALKPFVAHVYQNTNITPVTVPFSFAGITCLAGDTIKIQVSSSATTPAISANNGANYIAIKRSGN